MRVCLGNGVGFCLLLAGAVVGSGASLTEQLASPPHIKSVVKVDSRGRLVRAVVVTPVKQSTTKDAAPQDADLTIPELVESTAKQYDVDPLLVHSVIQVESNYNPWAVSPKGAQGMMQLMPATARRFGVSNSFDPRENVAGGVRYLKYLQSLFPDDPQLAVAAYNAGEGAVWKYNNRVPPYRETTDYVSRVGRRYEQARKAKSKKAANTASPAPEKTAEAVPAQPVYASVSYFVDGEGRLHMQTGNPVASPETKAP